MSLAQAGYLRLQCRDTRLDLVERQAGKILADGVHLGPLDGSIVEKSHLLLASVSGLPCQN